MNNKQNSGFTLIELMIVVSVISILLAVGAPSFQAVIERMNTNGQAKALLSTLNYARSEAIKRRTVVTICGSNNGTDCAAASWADGWLVFIDNNGDANGAVGSVDAGDEVLRVYEGLTGGNTLTYPSAMVQYDSQGFGRNIPTVPVQRFLICPESGVSAHAQGIDISITGRGSRVSTGLTC